MSTALDQGRRLMHHDRGEWNSYPDEMCELIMHGQPEDLEHAYRFLWLSGDFAPRLLHIPSEIWYSQPSLGEKSFCCSKTGYWAAAKDIVHVEGRPVIRAYAPTTFRRGAGTPSWLE